MTRRLFLCAAKAVCPCYSRGHYQEELGLWYGRLKHVLYRLVAVHGGKCKDYKNAFIEKHKITARQFNAMAMEVQGVIDGTTVLLEERLRVLKDTIKSKKASLKRALAQQKEVENRKRTLSPKKLAALLSRIYHLPLQIARLEKKLAEVKKRLAAKAPGICFGSRKLFNAQFHLKESGFASFQEWKCAAQAVCPDGGGDTTRKQHGEKRGPISSFS